MTVVVVDDRQGKAHENTVDKDVRWTKIDLHFLIQNIILTLLPHLRVTILALKYL